MSDEKEICGAETRSGDPCENAPMENGRCYHHGGATGSGAKEGNGNAEKHGLHSAVRGYYDRRDEDVQEYIDSVYEAFLEDAPFGEDNTGKSGILWEIAVNHHKRIRADDYLDARGVVLEHLDDGKVEADASPAIKVYDRIAKTDIKRLKALGVLDDPDSEQAKATNSIAQILSDEREKTESEDGEDDE